MSALLTRAATVGAVAAITTLSIATIADACSCMTWQTESHGVFAARSMDWAQTFDDALFINPRGRSKDGDSSKNPFKWTSKYGSLVASIHPFAMTKGFGIEDGATTASTRRA